MQVLGTFLLIQEDVPFLGEQPNEIIYQENGFQIYIKVSGGKWRGRRIALFQIPHKLMVGP